MGIRMSGEGHGFAQIRRRIEMQCGDEVIGYGKEEGRDG